MRHALIVLCLLLAPLAEATAEDAAAKYSTMLAADKQDPGSVDWQALRFSYADSPTFDFLGGNTAAMRHRMFQAFEDQDSPRALAQAKQIIEIAYIDIEAHRVAAVAYKHLGEANLSTAEKAIVEGLMSSIMTGDGLAPQTAYTVVSVQEEYELLHALGLKVTRQTLVNTGGHAYDLMGTADSNGVTQDCYFLIDRVMAAEAKMLNPQP